MKAIIVSGSVGTGKTTLAKKISKKGYKYIDVNKLVEEHSLEDGFDKSRDSKIIDTKKINKVLVKLIKDNEKSVIDSHLSHHLPKKHVDLCIITKCSLKELEKRLKKRKYDPKKIRENLDSEIFDTCYVEAKENGHIIKVVYTDKKISLGNILKD